VEFSFPNHAPGFDAGKILQGKQDLLLAGPQNIFGGDISCRKIGPKTFNTCIAQKRYGFLVGFLAVYLLVVFRLLSLFSPGLQASACEPSPLCTIPRG